MHSFGGNIAFTIHNFHMTDITLYLFLFNSRDREELCQGAVRKYFSFALAHTFLNDPSVAEYQRQVSNFIYRLAVLLEKWGEFNTYIGLRV